MGRVFCGGTTSSMDTKKRNCGKCGVLIGARKVMFSENVAECT